MTTVWSKFKSRVCSFPGEHQLLSTLFAKEKMNVHESSQVEEIFTWR